MCRTLFDRFLALKPLRRSALIQGCRSYSKPPAQLGLSICGETGGNEWRRNKRAMSRRQRAISVTQPLIPFCRASLHTRHPIPHSAPVRPLPPPPTIRVSLSSFQLRSSTVFGSTRRRRCDCSPSSSSSRRSSEELEASSLLVNQSFELLVVLTISFDGYERRFCLFVGYKQARRDVNLW